MQEHELFHEYLEKVCEQIRWKKARPIVRKELGDHLEDQQVVLIASGSTEDEAASAAVRDMGDALLVGTQLDRSYRPRPAWGVIATTAILMILGYFARDYVFRHVNDMHTIDVPRSLFFMGAAVAALMIGYFLDYTILGKHPILIGTAFIAVVMLLPYLDIGFISNNIGYRAYYYGTNLALFVPVIYAAILWWWPYKGYKGLIGSYLALILMAFAWLVFGWLPFAFFHCGICGIMLTAEVLKGKFNIRKSVGLLILYVPIALVFFLVWSVSKESIVNRISIAVYPWIEPEGAGFMGVQLREILANAKWFGHGSYTMHYVPGIVNDYMLAFFIHWFGWISLVVVLILFGALFVFSITRIRRQKSKLGRFVAVAALSSLLLQCVLYILNNLNGYISISILPLLSNGNAALLADSFLIGLLLSVFRTNDAVTDETIKPKTIPRFKIKLERLH